MYRTIEPIVTNFYANDREKNVENSATSLYEILANFS